MNVVDYKFANLLKGRVDRFQIKANNPLRINMRCPICGDSQKSTTKARGWILEKDNSAIYYCHNCGASLSLRNFLQKEFPDLYNQYTLDLGYIKFADSNEPKKTGLDTLTQSQPVFRKKGSPLRKLKKISSLKSDHPAKKYVEKREIPTNQHHKLYFAPKFNGWVNEQLPNKLNTKYDEPRMVLPFIDEKGNLFGFTGRAYNPKSLRYMTIMLSDDKPKIFGLNTVDFNETYQVVEGALDSLFLPNSIAMAGADIDTQGLRNIDKAVFIFDNEPRNREVVRRMEKMISNGHRICIWPSTIEEKDINDMVLAGINSVWISECIEKNTYSGLMAKLKLTEWKKV